MIYFFVKWSLSWGKYTERFYKAIKPHSEGSNFSLPVVAYVGNLFLKCCKIWALNGKLFGKVFSFYPSINKCMIYF